MKGTGILGWILLVATTTSLVGIWWDQRKMRKWEERRRRWQYLNQSDRDDSE